MKSCCIARAFTNRFSVLILCPTQASAEHLFVFMLFVNIKIITSILAVPGPRDTHKWNWMISVKIVYSSRENGRKNFSTSMQINGSASIALFLFAYDVYVCVFYFAVHE